MAMSIKHRTEKNGSSRKTSTEESDEKRRRWFARHRGDKFSELLRESAGETPLDDEWLERLDQAEEAGVGGEAVETPEDYAERPGQWSDLALDADLAREATAAIERLEGSLSDLDKAVTRAKAASRDTRALLQRLQSTAERPTDGAQRPSTTRQPARTKTGRQAKSGWVKAQRRAENG